MSKSAKDLQKKLSEIQEFPEIPIQYILYIACIVDIPYFFWVYKKLAQDVLCLGVKEYNLLNLIVSHT